MHRQLVFQNMIHRLEHFNGAVDTSYFDHRELDFLVSVCNFFFGLTLRQMSRLMGLSTQAILITEIPTSLYSPERIKWVKTFFKDVLLLRLSSFLFLTRLSHEASCSLYRPSWYSGKDNSRVEVNNFNLKYRLLLQNRLVETILESSSSAMRTSKFLPLCCDVDYYRTDR